MFVLLTQKTKHSLFFPGIGHCSKIRYVIHDLAWFDCSSVEVKDIERASQIPESNCAPQVDFFYKKNKVADTSALIYTMSRIESIDMSANLVTGLHMLIYSCCSLIDIQYQQQYLHLLRYSLLVNLLECQYSNLPVASERDLKGRCLHEINCCIEGNWEEVRGWNYI